MQISDKINAEIVKEVKNLTVILENNQSELVALYRNYPNFTKMYQQYSTETSELYTKLFKLLTLYYAYTNKLISDKEAYENLEA